MSTLTLRIAAVMLGVLGACGIAGAQSAPPAAAPAAGQDHAGHEGKPQAPPPAAQEGQAEEPVASQDPPDLPPITDADRAAAFPALNGHHAVHDDGVHYYVLFDRIEWRTGDGAAIGSWENRGWIGRDVNRFWFRSEGTAGDGRLAEAEAHALFGRAINPWWDLVAGVRQDFRPGPGRTWAALGIQGLSPYWFDVEATLYIGESGRTHFRFETEYELLVTNRLILQPAVELDFYGKPDPQRGIGDGLSFGEAGLRLRYEIRRELAPYLGILWERRFFDTADFARGAGDRTRATKLVLGARIWL